MPITEIQIFEPETVYDNVTAWISVPEGVGLRQDFDSPDAPLFPETIFRFPPWSAAALKEFRAITPTLPRLSRVDLRAVHDGSYTHGYLDVRISLDNGVTFRYWGGSSWDLAGPADFSTFDDLNDNLASIPFEPEWTLLIECRLTIGVGGDFRIPVRGVALAYELLPTHDFLDPFRLIRRELAAKVAPTFRQIFTLATATDTFDLGSALKVGSVVSAYNLTTDPTRVTDLFLSYSEPDVQLTAIQALGDLIEVVWICTLADNPLTADKPRWVILSNQDPDFFNEQVKHVPLLIVQVSETKGVGFSQLYGIPVVQTINFPKQTYWKEEPPDGMEYRLIIYALASDEGLAVKLIDSAYQYLRGLKSQKTVLRTIFTGLDAQLTDVTQPFTNLSDTSENVAVKSLQCLVYVREWRGAVETGPLAETFTRILEVAL